MALQRMSGAGDGGETGTEDRVMLAANHQTPVNAREAGAFSIPPPSLITVLKLDSVGYKKIRI